jgi:cytoskeletal protein RodZ
MEPTPKAPEPRFEGEVMKLPRHNTDNSDTTPTTPTLSHHRSFALVIALLFLALILVLGGLVIWNQQLLSTPVVVTTPTRPDAASNQEPESTTARAQAEAATALSTSSELPTIAADLASTDLTNLTSEFTAIEETLRTAP